MRSRKHILLLGGITAIIAGASFFLVLHKDTSEVAGWRIAIKTMGASEAYRKLEGEIGTLTNQEQHVAEHYFGRALYDELNIPGYSICGQGFTGGCMHEFVAAAVQENGMGILKQLNNTCQEFANSTTISCQHGIGHGVMNYLGYTEESLVVALNICKSFSPKEPIKGCYGGTFMEFNERTVSGRNARSLPADRPYAPCDKISSDYASACYFWLPHWLGTEKGLGFGDEERFKILGEYCSGVSSEKLATMCFSGIGYRISLLTGFTADKVSALCDKVSATQKYRDACRSTTSWAFLEFTD